LIFSFENKVILLLNEKKKTRNSINALGIMNIKLRGVVHSVIPAFGRLKQEDLEFGLRN
jgi:hypothetical protein